MAYIHSTKTTLTIGCINKDERKNPYERIINVGGVTTFGTRWKKSQPTVVREIDAGTHEYYVGQGIYRVRVITATSPYGNKYIKTEADGKEPNNLLSLPECP